MSKGEGVKTMMGKTVETAEPSSWELKNSRQIAVEPAWTELGPLLVGGSCVSWMAWGYSQQWDQDLSLVHELAFGVHFL